MSAVILLDLSSFKSSPSSFTIGLNFHELHLQKNCCAFRGFLEVPLKGIQYLYWNTEIYGRCGRFFEWGSNEEFASKGLESLGVHNGSALSPGTPSYFMVLHWADEEMQFLHPTQDLFKKHVEAFMRMEYVGKMHSYKPHIEWEQLSSCISWPLVKRLRPANSQWIQSDLLKEEKEHIENHYRGSSDLLSSRSTNKKSSIFTEVPKTICDASLTPMELTQLNFDKSILLRRLLSTEYDGETAELLGEYQYAFVSFLIGHCYDALQQWQSLLFLLSQSNDALKDSNMEGFWKQFILIVYHQLRVLPSDFMSDNLSSENFLFDSLCQFFDLIDLAPKEIGRQMTTLKQSCEKKFECTFELNDDDDFAPVYVVDEND